MAFIRAFGGGGIPSALKSAMNAVLNKKFGTSTTYAPEDWPEDVNLLGPLPEKTVSGSIANLSDGADTVPLKSWDVTVNANLDGVSSIKVTQAGKNLLDESLKKIYGHNIYYNEGISQNAGYSAILPAGTYTYSVTTADGTNTNLYARNFDTSTNISGFPAYGVLKKTFTLTETTRVSFWIYKDTYTSLSDIVNAQVEVGSTNTAHAAYTAPTVTTVSLGRTIYGGSADVVMGEGQATYKGYNLENLTWSGSYFDGNWVWYTDLSADGLKIPFASEVFSGICDTYTPINYSGVSSNTNTIALRQNGSLYVNNGSSETEPTGKVTIELDTPTDFTFTPTTPTPETALGVNNFWADEGDSEVTYRADISLALAANSSRGLMMASRSIPEDEILNENTEEVENDENIRQDPADR